MLPFRSTADERADLAAAVRVGDPCGGNAVGGVGHDDDVGNLGAGRGGGEGVGEDGASCERGEQFVAAAHARAAAGGQQHAGGAHSVCSPLRAAKIMRPAWVWMTRLTTTSRDAPSWSAACSTTTIVPSGR